MPLKKDIRKKVPANVPKVSIDKISFHFVENVENGSLCTKRGRLWKGNLGRMPLNIRM